MQSSATSMLFESGNTREDARLRDALLELRTALLAHLEATGVLALIEN